jgi:hypothetical protein
VSRESSSKSRPASKPGQAALPPPPRASNSDIRPQAEVEPAAVDPDTTAPPSPAAGDSDTGGVRPLPADSSDTEPEPATEKTIETPALSKEGQSGVEATLAAFESAFQDESTPGLRRIQPSLTQDDLAVYQRQFLNNRSVTVRLGNVRIVPVSSTRVEVYCSITREIVPERGTPRRQSGNARLALEIEEGTWLIRDLRAPGWW